MHRKGEQLTEKDWLTIRKLHEQGFDAKAIGKRFNRSGMFIREGLKVRKGGDAT